MRNLIFSFFFANGLYAAEFLSNSECGAKAQEVCIATKKGEFVLLSNENRQIKFLEIAKSIKQMKGGFKAGLEFDPKKYEFLAIRPKRYEGKLSSEHKDYAYGLQVEIHASGYPVWKYYDSNMNTQDVIGSPCNWEYRYDKSGKLISKKYHDLKCKQGTGVVRFFLPAGTYYVTEPPLRMRESPSLKAKTIATLDKDEKVEVLDYTTERLEIKGSYAPWAKVKTAKGEGWVYGAYIEPVNYGETYKKFFQNIDWKAFAEKMGLE